MKTLKPDQQEAVDFAYEHDYSLLKLPTGFGKTVVALTVVQELLAAGELSRVLVLAPLRVIEGTWMTEQDDWAHLDLKISFAIGDATTRLNAFSADSQVVVMNYENVAWFANHFGKKHGFDGVVYDELTKLKTVSGTQFKKLRYLYDTFKWRCGMAAGSDNDGLIDLYGQMMMLDNGAALGRRKDKFLWRWFTPIDYQQRQWEPRPGAAEEIAGLIAPCVYAPDTKDYENSLPRLSLSYWGVELPSQAMKIYKEMEREAVVADHDIKAVNAAVVSGKLQQVCSGFMYDDEDVIDIHRVKQDEVRRLTQGLVGPILISYWFDEELAQLQELFPDAEVVGKGCVQDLCRRWNAGEVPVMLIHPRSGGHGLNIQYGGFQLIMFSPIWSNDLTHQLISRLRRRGQTSDVVNVHMVVAEKTLETELMVPRVEGKKSDAEIFSAYLAGV